MRLATESNRPVLDRIGIHVGEVWSCHEDDLRFKLAPLEQTGNRMDTKHPSILAVRLSGQAPKVATLPSDSLTGQASVIRCLSSAFVQQASCRFRP